MSTGAFLLFPHHRPRLGEPAGSQLYPVYSAALVSEHFKTPRQIAEALLFPHRNQGRGDHHIGLFQGIETFHEGYPRPSLGIRIDLWRP